MTRLLVTGAGGMLGQDVVTAATNAGHAVVPMTHGALDVGDAAAVHRAVRDAGADAVINCAAWTDVDGAESHEAAALAINGVGAANVARAAADAGTFTVHVSTDYVFDGRARTPYVESDATGPIGAYGRTKLAGELAVAAAGPRHAIVRTAWLFGVGGPNFVETMLRLADERDEVSVVTDQIGCPTWTGHLAGALVAVAERRTAGLLHVAGGGSCSWNAFAREIFRAANVPCSVSETTTAAFPRPAARPAWSVLTSERDEAPVLPSWQDGLSGYLAARGAAATMNGVGA